MLSCCIGSTIRCCPLGFVTEGDLSKFIADNSLELSKSFPSDDALLISSG